MQKNQIELNVVVNVNPIKEYGHKGLTYIEARRGKEYTLKIKNHYNHRVLVVPSVDGLNTLNGEPAFNNHEGYVVPAYGSIVIDGWRTSLTEVNKFVFDYKKNSYSEKSGNGDYNCGVIGIQVFGEKLLETPIIWWNSQTNLPYGNTYQTPGWLTPCYINDNRYAQPICATNASGNNYNYTTSFSGNQLNYNNDISLKNYSVNSTQTSDINESADTYKLGTAFGETKESVVSQTSFIKGDLLNTLDIYYTDREGLESLGIDVDKRTTVAFTRPQSFGRFCKPPNE